MVSGHPDGGGADRMPYYRRVRHRPREQKSVIAMDQLAGINACPGGSAEVAPPKACRMSDQTLAKARSSSWFYAILPLAVAAGIFFIDTFTKLDIAIAVLYVVVVLVSAGFLNRKGILAVGGICMFLAVLSYLIVHGRMEPGSPAVRCLISLCVIGITTFLTVTNQKVTQELSSQAALLNLTHDAIFVRDLNDVITYWNAGAEELYGWRREEATGRRASELLNTRFPTALEIINERLQLSDRWQGELTHTTRNGTELTVASRWSPQRDERGRLVATMETNSDITEHKRAEDQLHQARSQLSHVNRVATLGELTASIAHEVNQPLAAVVTNGEACLRWLSRDVPELGEVQLSVERMISNGRRASEVVARLRALARKDASQRVELDLNDIVDDVLPLVEREIFRHRIKLVVDLASPAPRVLGDRIQLQQVLLNLVVNAIQAMSTIRSGPRTLTIVSDTRLDGASSKIATLKVNDTGPGIASDAVDRLFMAFYTTKTDGMGMGLSICRSIIEAHGGRIAAAPGAEGGASFVLELPLLEGVHA
jgi:PAS domain S-box-containing protein